MRSDKLKEVYSASPTIRSSLAMRLGWSLAPLSLLGPYIFSLSSSLTGICAIFLQPMYCVLVILASEEDNRTKVNTRSKTKYSPFNHDKEPNCNG